MATDTGRNNRLQSRPLLHDHPAALRLAAVLWALAALLFIAIAVPAIFDEVQTVDNAIYDAAVASEWGPAVFVAKGLDLIGTWWVTFPLMAIVAGFLAWRRRWEAFFTWVVVMVVSQLFIGPVKDIYDRVRPPRSLVATTSWSFPSGHAVAGAAIAITLVIVLIPAGPRRRNLELIAAAFALLMAASRVYLRAHWFTDVAAGAALGAAIAIGTAALIHRIDDRRRGEPHIDHAV